MNDHTEIPPAAGAAEHTDQVEQPPVELKRKRRVVIPAVVAALALGAAGTGIGYAAVHGQATTATTPQASTSTRMQQAFDSGPGYAGGRYSTDPYGDSASPYGYSQGQDQTQGQGTQSTDTTGTASGSQLTGLVRIASTMKYDGAKAAGTGMVLTADGEVVTNHHVVEGATSIKVTVMATGETYTARVVGTDATDDVAVLQLVDASGLDTVTTDTAGVTTGDAVTAVGDGEGTVDHLSSATGSVLATDQSITTQSEGTASSEQLTDLIEISSDVVGGYSGGATYDADGEVVGMTTAASSGASDIVGYAIPISKVLSIADDLTSGVSNTAYDYDQPAFLGIGLGSGTTLQGAYDGTPAADAGIGAGDQITSVGGIATTTATQLRAAIASHSPGDDVKITWTDTDGGSHSTTVTLAKGPVE